MKNSILFYGSQEEPPRPVVLTAGPLNMEYKNGFLRHIKIGEAEVVNMIYYALRDENWGTHHGTIKNEKIKTKPKGFEVSYRSVVSAGSIQYVYDCLIKGSNEGKVEFTLQGMSYARFRKNRIGFCVLHGVNAYAGKPVKILGADKSETDGMFPETAEPFQPYVNIKSMRWEPAKGYEAEIRFDGDVFEMEDQRNWSDATYKTYCTPLSDPVPVEIKMGDTLKQKVVLSVTALKKGAIKTKPATAPEISVGKSALEQKLPAIGFYDSSEYKSYTPTDISFLKNLSMHHLRVDLDMEKVSPKEIDDLKMKSENLGTSLILALYFGGDPHQEIQNFESVISGKSLPVDSIIVLDKKLLRTSAGLMNHVAETLRRLFPGIPVGGGSDQYFAELNRNINDIPVADFLVFPSSPQSHLVDQHVMIDNIDGAAGAVRKALIHSGGKPVYISPVSLMVRTTKLIESDKMNFGDQLPDDVDPKQVTLFVAAWTVAYIRELSEAGISVITFFETTGWKGIIQGRNAPSLPSLFRSQADAVFPVYFIFYWLAKLRGAHIVPVQSTFPGTVTGLCLQLDKEKFLFLVNLSEDPQTFPVRNFKKGEIISRLNEKTAASFLKDPLSFLEKNLANPLEETVQMMPYEVMILKS